MSYDIEDRPKKHFFTLDENYQPRIVYEPVADRLKTGEIVSDEFRDRKLAKELFELINSRPAFNDEESKKLNIETHINIVKIREILETKEVPMGKDYYASFTLVSNAEPTYLSFVSSGDYVNVPSAAVIPLHPGKKLFKMTIKVATQPCKFSLNNKSFEKKIVTTLNATEEYTFEAKAGVIESVTLQATAAGNTDVRIFGFY